MHLHETFSEQSTSRFPWSQDRSGDQEEKPLVDQKTRLKRKIFLCGMGQRSILHKRDLEDGNQETEVYKNKFTLPITLA